MFVGSNGHCIWVTPGRYSTVCTVDISRFPFDNQTCEFDFYSYMYTGLELNVTFAGFAKRKITESGEWNIGKFTPSRSSSVAPDTPTL